METTALLWPETGHYHSTWTCLACKRLKKTCDKRMPICTQCRVRGSACSYNRCPQMGRPRRVPTSLPAQRVAVAAASGRVAIASARAELADMRAEVQRMRLVAASEIHSARIEFTCLINGIARMMATVSSLAPPSPQRAAYLPEEVIATYEFEPLDFVNAAGTVYYYPTGEGDAMTM
jgi:hypothetical protein